MRNLNRILIKKSKTFIKYTITLPFYKPYTMNCFLFLALIKLNTSLIKLIIKNPWFIFYSSNTKYTWQQVVYHSNNLLDYRLLESSLLCLFNFIFNFKNINNKEIFKKIKYNLSSNNHLLFKIDIKNNVYLKKNFIKHYNLSFLKNIESFIFKKLYIYFIYNYLNLKFSSNFSALNFKLFLLQNNNINYLPILLTYFKKLNISFLYKTINSKVKLGLFFIKKQTTINKINAIKFLKQDFIFYFKTFKNIKKKLLLFNNILSNNLIYSLYNKKLQSYLIISDLSSFKNILHKLGLLTKNKSISYIKSLIFFSFKNIRFFFNTIIYNLLHIYSYCDNFYIIKYLINYYVKWSYTLTLKIKYKKFSNINSNNNFNRQLKLFKYQNTFVN